MEDLDDLFDDQLDDQLNSQLNEQLSGQLQRHLQIGSPSFNPPGLAERIDELKLSGCVNRISWSTTGSIAYLTGDRRNIRVTNLRRDDKDAKWIQNKFMDPSLSESVQKIYKGRQLVHVEWNPNHMSELVASDIHGRIGIFTMWHTSCINRLVGLRVLSIDPEDSLNALVGMFWLNCKRSVPLSRVSQKLEGRWKYNLTQFELRGPYVPNNKSAFVAITRGGLVRLGYQVQTAQGQSFQEIRHDLDGFSTSGDLLTHAGLCVDRDDNILVAVHTYSRQIRLYSMKIDWHIPKPGEQAQISPTIDCQHLVMIDACHLGISQSAGMFDQIPELYHLQIIPRGPDPRDVTYPCVLAAFHQPLDDVSGQNGLPQTLISRWEFREETPALDVSFAQLGSKKSGIGELKTEHILTQLEDVKVESTVMSVQLLHHSTIVALSGPDGAVEVRNRSLLPLGLNESLDKVTNLFDMGFSFKNRDSCLHTVLSPNATVKAYFGRDHEIKCSSLEPPAFSMDNDGAEKIAAAFVVSNTVSEASNMGSNTNDDLLMTMENVLAQMSTPQRYALRDTFLRDIFTLFGFHEKILEGISSIDKTVRLPATARCLSLQAAIGDRGTNIGRTLESKVAYTALNMRHFALSLTMAIGKSPSSSEPELNKPEIQQFLINLISWFGTLVDYICDQLLDLNRSLDVKNLFNLQGVRNRVENLNTPALHLVLSSFTRTLLRHDCRALRSIWSLPQTAHAQAGSPLYQLYVNLMQTLRSNIISPFAFEGLLAELDELIKNAYEGLSEEQKQEIEFRILLNGDIPDELGSVVQSILIKAVEKIRRDPQSESELAFKDWKVLGLVEDARSKRWANVTIYDSLRKIELSQGARTRRCTRCSARMEDLLGPKLLRGSVVLSQMFRSCFCGGHWLVSPLPESA